MGSTTKKGNTANPGLSKAQEVPPPSFSIITGPFELMIHAAATGNVYIGWTPTRCSLRITNNPQPALNVVLKNRDINYGGQVDFRSTYTDPDQDMLALTLPGDGTPVNFYISGKFGKPSFHDQDGAISVNDAGTDAALHQRKVMVRIRKDANVLTNAERDRFLNAYATVNSNTALYQVFLDSHNSAADGEIHVRPAFLPWHRAFVLALERQLQLIDASVTIPYWRFERTAPNIFTPDFMGSNPDSAGRVTLSPSNPLRNWSVLGVTGIIRVPGFNDQTQSPGNYNGLLNEADTQALGSDFVNFRTMEGNPHGSAHVSFTSGPITSPPTATRDPIFFMLHCNIDRLWAKWQLVLNLFGTSNTAYSTAGSVKVGDALADTMWPWNGVTTPPRPSTAPGGPMPQLSFPGKPSPQVTVGEVIDYIGKTEGNYNYFDYDDVPFPS